MTRSIAKGSLKAAFPSFRRKPESSFFHFFCILIFSGITAFSTFLSCSLPKPSALLEGPKLKGFEQAGPLTVYNRTNLFDYMNGEAEAYLPSGFHLLYVSVFRSEHSDSRSVLEIYDMSTPEGAASILKKYSSEGGSSLTEIGDAAWADQGILLFRQSKYFVRIFPDPSPENEVRPTLQEMRDLARQMMFLL